MNVSTPTSNSPTSNSPTKRRRWIVATATILAAVAIPGAAARAAGTEDDPPTTTSKGAAPAPASGSNPTTTVSAAAKAGNAAGEHYEAGKAHIAKGEWAAAISELEQADKLQPDNADVNNLLGHANRKLGKLDVSLKYYQKALKINPKHLGANEYLGELYLMMNQLPKAKTQLATLSKLCGKTCEEYVDLKTAIASYKAPTKKK